MAAKSRLCVFHSCSRGKELRRAPVHLYSKKRLLHEVSSANRVLDVGSGGRRLASHVTTTDVVARQGVDIVGDVCSGLPLPDASYDLIVCTSVLEHVANDRSAIQELIRLVSPGGRVWIEVPFLYHFHVSGLGDTQDYRRWTLEGCKHLVPGLRLIDFGHNVGPATALRLTASEVIALPFYNEHHQGIYHLVAMLTGWLLYPISLLDPICMRSNISHRVSGGFWLLWEKP